MNRCEYCKENLSAYLDGEMPENERNNLEEHLRECASCSRELEILRAIVTACGELEEELPDGFDSSLRVRLEEARKEILAERDKKVKVKLFSQIAAGFLIVITLGVAVRFGFFSDKSMPEQNTESEMAPMAAGPTSVEFLVPESSEDASVSIGVNSAEKTGSDSAKKQDFAYNKSMKVQNDAAEGDQEPKDGKVALQFNESVVKPKTEEYDYDTEIVIVVDDIDKAIKSIMEIDEKIGMSRENNSAYLMDSINACRGNRPNGYVELKLVYSSEEAQRSFVEEMKSTFSDIQVESVPPDSKAKDETECIKIIIEKKK